MEVFWIFETLALGKPWFFGTTRPEKSQKKFSKYAIFHAI